MGVLAFEIEYLLVGLVRLCNRAIGLNPLGIVNPLGWPGVELSRLPGKARGVIKLFQIPNCAEAGFCCYLPQKHNDQNHLSQLVEMFNKFTPLPIDGAQP